MKLHGVTIQIKATEQYFHVAMFVFSNINFLQNEIWIFFLFWTWHFLHQEWKG